MKEILQKLDKLSTARPLEIIRKKKEGSKVVEFFGDFVPEQWITAAGAESYLIMKGGDPQSPEATLDYSIRFMNPLAASMVGNYLRGVDRVMPMADGVVQRSYCTESGLLATSGCPGTAVGYYNANDLPAACNYDHSGGVVPTQLDTTGIDTD